MVSPLLLGRVASLRIGSITTSRKRAKPPARESCGYLRRAAPRTAPDVRQGGVSSASLGTPHFSGNHFAERRNARGPSCVGLTCKARGVRLHTGMELALGLWQPLCPFGGRRSAKWFRSVAPSSEGLAKAMVTVEPLTGGSRCPGTPEDGRERRASSEKPKRVCKRGGACPEDATAGRDRHHAAPSLRANGGASSVHQLGRAPHGVRSLCLR